MKRLICHAAIYVALTVAFGATTHGALDLTATPEEYNGEGVIYRRLVVKNGTRPVEIYLPSGWTHRGDGPASLHLIPKGATFAEAVIRTEPLPASAVIDDATTASLQQQALSTVPSDSQATSLVQTNVGLIGPGGREAVEVVVSYKRLGYTFMRSQVFANMADYRLVLQCVAMDAEFERINDAFRRAVQAIE
jgi:hypothetical protein